MKLILENWPSQIAKGMTFTKYRGIDALNPSSIVRAQQSMLHVYHALTDDSEVTPSLEFGRALHCALLEPRKFALEYEPAEGRRTLKVREEAAERGVELLKPADYETILATALQASKCKDLQPFIREGNAEVSVLTMEQGCRVKGRLDWIASDPLAILDVKTARDIDEWSFSRAFYRYHYDVKLGLYQRWLQQEMQVPSIPVYLLLVENHPPHDCAVVPRCEGDPVPIPEAVLMRGAAKGVEWIKQIKRSIVSGEWPGVGDSANWSLNTPAWEMDDEEIEGAEVA